MSKKDRAEFHKIFRAELKKDTLVVSPAGDSISFRESDINKEVKAVMDWLDDPAVVNLVVDLGASRYFGTTIIGAFNALGTKVLEAGGRIALCNASDDMRGILGVMNLDELWPLFNTRKAALKAVGA